MARQFLTMALAALVGVFTFSSAADAQDNYRVRAGDVLRVEVIEDPSLNRSVLVSPDGRIALPLAGAIQARGRTIEQIEAVLTAQLAPSFANTPTVFVGIERLFEPRERIPLPPAPDPVITIHVLGEAGQTGKIELAPGTTLLQAFAEFGGFSNFAATKRIQLRRGDTIYEINYDAILTGESPNGQVTVAEGDVIIVPQRKLFE